MHYFLKGLIFNYVEIHFKDTIGFRLDKLKHTRFSLVSL